MITLWAGFAGDVVDGLDNPREGAHRGIAHEESQRRMQQEESNNQTDDQRPEQSRCHTGPLLHAFFGQLIHDPASHPPSKLTGKVECAHESTTPAQCARDLARQLVEFSQRVVGPVGQARACEECQRHAGQSGQFYGQAAPSAFKSTPSQVAGRYEVRHGRDDHMIDGAPYSERSEYYELPTGAATDFMYYCR